MSVGYIDSQGNYYEGDRQGFDAVVPQRPSPDHKFINGEWQVDLTNYKAKKSAELDKARSDALAAGVQYNGHTYDTDDVSLDRINRTITAVSVAGASLPEGFVWRTQDNIDVPVTIDDLKGLAAAILNFQFGVMAKSFNLKNQVTAATDQATIDAVVWS